ncbi:hypothetical protein [Lacisediminihabitans changchengi]|uniref:SAF domain-containing protein n=1 Tax=Lacisediminihabitans changchengi TaxID=2787634 RepID=A0A934VX11_9MICO|nr:hypothetical protein [Lacisediminihabitans changchengi]MBK4346397.1 hypothetical protein [Lacisediminihabitans changchengi]
MAIDNAGSGGRAPRRWWFDVRFAIGLGLVALSVAGVFVVVSAADHTVLVYVARTALSPGDRLSGGDLVRQSVQLGEASSRYLGIRDVPASGLIVTRAVAEGELVPASAVGTSASRRLASVVVPVRQQLAKAIDAGEQVDLWAAEQTDDRDFGAPSVLVPAAQVVRVIAADGIIADGGAGSVEVLVPRAKVARVLEAVANDDAISLVPAGAVAKG